MANGKTATTTAEARRLKLEMTNLADKLADTMVQYMRALGLTGITTPTPPRPKREVITSVAFGDLRFQLAFNAKRGPRR
jgi:hypothetical protein